MASADDSASRPASPPFRRQPPLVIGLLGGIASGKSTVARAFAERGLVHVDADQLARQVVAEPAVRAALAEAFGAEILDRDGGLDRTAMAARAFRDPAVRRRLEAITHPPIRAAIVQRMQSALAVGNSVLLDVPLLLENGLIEHCHQTVFVDASDATRRQRARARGWDEAELQRREAAQAPLAVKKARATITIDNDGTVEHTEAQVAEILRSLASAPA